MVHGQRLAVHCIKGCICMAYSSGVASQDPVVFSGTVRDNLDPFGASAGDGAVWAALRQTGMADTITQLVGSHYHTCYIYFTHSAQSVICFFYPLSSEVQVSVFGLYVVEL